MQQNYSVWSRIIWEDLREWYRGGGGEEFGNNRAPGYDEDW